MRHAKIYRFHPEKRGCKVNVIKYRAKTWFWLPSLLFWREMTVLGYQSWCERFCQAPRTEGNRCYCLETLNTGANTISLIDPNNEELSASDNKSPDIYRYEVGDLICLSDYYKLCFCGFRDPNQIKRDTTFFANKALFDFRGHNRKFSQRSPISIRGLTAKKWLFFLFTLYLLMLTFSK